MPFPTTLDELRNGGYKFENDSHCRGCGASIEWFETPKGKKMPFDVDEKGNVESHFSSTPKANDFRKEK
jgi:hypothetical protein